MPSLRWLLLDFTDPRFDLTPEQKREIRQRVRRIRFFDRPVFTLGMPRSNEVRQAKLRRRSALARWGSRLPMAGLYLCWAALVLYAPHLARQVEWHILVAILLMTAAVLWVVTCWVGAAMARSWYRYAMYELGYEICAECGYPLYGLDASTHCPECGWRKTHRDDPPPVEWTDADRATLRQHGYETCETCGGLLLMTDAKCPRCGLPRENAATAT